MPDYEVKWNAPSSNMPVGSPEEDHYDIKFGEFMQQEHKGALSSKFDAMNDPGSYPTSVQLYDVNGQPIGPPAVGPVVVIGDGGTVTVHIPEGVTAGVAVTILP